MGKRGIKGKMKIGTAITLLAIVGSADAAKKKGGKAEKQ
jgi:hypothetical protein